MCIHYCVRDFRSVSREHLDNLASSVYWLSKNLQQIVKMTTVKYDFIDDDFLSQC